MGKRQLKSLSVITLISFFLSTICLPSNAFGPLVVSSGQPAKYSAAMKVRYDQGALGTLSNTDAITLIDGLLNDWEISTSSISIVKDSPDSIGSDITGNSSNLSSIVNGANGYTPIIFDSDGSIIDTLFGSGFSNSILGFAGPKTSGTTIVESVAVFNGKFSASAEFNGTIKHELGHAVGLDHSFHNNVTGSSSQAARDAVPLMYPIAVTSLSALQEDDKASIGSLYPNATFNSNTATISGNLFRADGSTHFEGANIVAERIDNIVNYSYSCVSGYLDNATGSYKISGLTPGTYRLRTIPLPSGFNSGSSVGPHAETSSDKSFINPVPVGYFTGINSPISATIGDAATILVSAGDTVSNQNFIGAFSSSSTSSTSSCGGTINESEPNNTIIGAQSISCLPTTIDGMAADGDAGEIELTSGAGNLTLSDLFRFTQESSGTFTATLVNNGATSNDDLDIALLSNDGAMLIDTSSASGNSDESISRTLDSGTYLLGIGAFSGSANYSLTLNGQSGGNSSGGSGSESITLTQKFDKDTIVIGANKSRRGTRIKKLNLKASAEDFTERASCETTITYKDDSDNTINDVTLKARPTQFKIGGSSSSTRKNKTSPGGTNNKRIQIILSNKTANYISSNYSTVVATVTVTCANGASTSYDVNIVANSSDLRLNDSNRYRKPTQTNKQFRLK